MAKIAKYQQILRIFAKFSKFGAKVFRNFRGFETFSANFSGRSWKMQKNTAFLVKIGVDTADVLIFWVEKRILILWWYFDTLALCKIKVKMQVFSLENLQPEALGKRARSVDRRLVGVPNFKILLATRESNFWKTRVYRQYQQEVWRTDLNMSDISSSFS